MIIRKEFLYLGWYLLLCIPIIIAYIKIIKVEGYGSSFPEKFSKKQKVQVKFVYSLKPYKKDKIDLPGLKRRDIIKVKISARQKINSNKAEYLIYNYQRL